MRRLLIATVLFAFLGLLEVPSAHAWGWKKSTTPTDMLTFLNGTGAYSRPVGDARVSCGNIGGAYDLFHAFYKTAGPANGGWVHETRSTPQEVLDLLNGAGRGAQPVGDAQICLLSDRRYGALEYHVFHRPLAPGELPFPWEYESETDVNVLVRVLNGKGGDDPASTARIVAVGSGGTVEHGAFLQRTQPGGEIDNWSLVTAPDEAAVLATVTAPGFEGFELTAHTFGSNMDFRVFENRGTEVWALSPFDNERFVGGEEVPLHAIITSEAPHVAGGVTWSSSLDGALGAGIEFGASGLTTGPHLLTATGEGESTQVDLRMFADLQGFWEGAPTQEELDRVASEFNIELVDGAGADELWAPYENNPWSMTSPEPSPNMLLATLDLLRHQAFDVPLPEGIAALPFDQVAGATETIRFHLDCGSNTAGGTTMNLRRQSHLWFYAVGGDCKTTGTQPRPYHSAAYIVMHESRHNEPTDAGHTTCPGSTLGADANLENGSGYARALLYSLWVWRYGTYDTPAAKAQASSIVGTLESRICGGLVHSDPVVMDALTDWQNSQ